MKDSWQVCGTFPKTWEYLPLSSPSVGNSGHVHLHAYLKARPLGPLQLQARIYFGARKVRPPQNRLGGLALPNKNRRYARLPGSIGHGPWELSRRTDTNAGLRNVEKGQEQSTLQSSKATQEPSPAGPGKKQPCHCHKCTVSTLSTSTDPSTALESTDPAQARYETRMF